MFDRPKPIPSTPTHCKCGKELPPLRRWGGQCADCVRERVQVAQVPEARWTLIESFVQVRRNGIRERFVRVRCSCGAERTMSSKDYEQRRSLRCNRCRLKEVRVKGVESDYHG